MTSQTSKPKKNGVIEFFFAILRGPVLDWTRKWLLELVLKKILGTAIGGVWGFLVNTVFKILWKKLLAPLYFYMMRKSKTAIKRPFYKRKAKKVKDADTKDDSDSAIDDLP